MNQYLLKRNRAKFIERNFFEWKSYEKPDDNISDEESFDINIPVADRVKFDSLSHPAELHYLASIYNWDDGPSVLEWVVDSPLCSKATANLIFWRAQPDFYTRFELNAVKPDDEYDENYDVLRLLRKIIEKHRKNNFSSYNIEFDPRDELEDLREKSPKWVVPEALYEKIKGTHIIVGKNRININQRTIIIAIIFVYGLRQVWKLIAH